VHATPNALQTIIKVETECNVKGDNISLMCSNRISVIKRNSPAQSNVGKHTIFASV
jgi:hypothetical protein